VSDIWCDHEDEVPHWYQNAQYPLPHEQPEGEEEGIGGLSDSLS